MWCLKYIALKTDNCITTDYFLNMMVYRVVQSLQWDDEYWAPLQDQEYEIDDLILPPMTIYQTYMTLTHTAYGLH